MIKVTSMELNASTNKAVVTLFADAKSDVSASMDIPGLPEGYDVDFGSSVITASGDIAFYKSNNTWNWV